MTNRVAGCFALFLIGLLAACTQPAKNTSSPAGQALGTTSTVAGTNVIVVPDMDKASGDAMSVSMMHGLWWTVHGGDPDPVPGPECSGSGDRAHALQMKSSRGTGRIEDVMPCVRVAYPGSTWSGVTALVIDAARYYSVVRVTDSSGSDREVYADVTEWAKGFIAEMHN
jgi:hypothetical protein